MKVRLVKNYFNPNLKVVTDLIGVLIIKKQRVLRENPMIYISTMKCLRFVLLQICYKKIFCVSFMIFTIYW